MPEFLDPVRDELDRLRAALAAADQRITDLTTERDGERAFLKQRSDAVNRAGESNDTLRATIARVEKVVSGWRSYPLNHPLPVCRTVAACKDEIRAALDAEGES